MVVMERAREVSDERVVPIMEQPATFEAFFHAHHRDVYGAMWLIEQAGNVSSIEDVPAPEASYVPEGSEEPDLSPIELSAPA